MESHLKHYDDIDILNRIKNGFFEDPTFFDLHTQAEYLSLVRDVDCLFSALSSKAKLLPHQVGVVHKVMSDFRTGGLLADEVGLGKTIETGMILKEYLCQKLTKILILTPASLTTQWRDELKSKFDEEFIIYDQETRKNLGRQHKNIWLAHDKIICSIDTAKQQYCRDDITATEWDVVIVDEAHKLKNRKTENYKLLEVLPKNRVLFLTATPLQNKLEELYNLISLIDEKIFGTYDYFSMKFMGDTKGLVPSNFKDLKLRLQKIMIRNRRRNAFGVKFTQRFGETISFRLTSEERKLYENVTSYVKQEYLKAKEQNKAGRGFLLIIMQRMACSSSFAIEDSLRRRIERLKKISKEHDIITKQPSSRTLVDECRLNLSQLPKKIAEEKFKEISEAYETLIDDIKREHIVEEHENTYVSDIAKNPALLQLELSKLKELSELTSKITRNSKGERLVEALEALKREEPNEKVLIYTEFRSTQRYLHELLTRRGHHVAIFNGSMKVDEKDEQVKQWRENKQIMISTECGGEGRNFQFCHIMFNYDLPWNPMRIEQRIGRIHRIGQEKNVKIFNFSTKGTIEEDVLELLETKIQLFRKVIGELDLILGDISEDANLERVIIEILVKSKTVRELKENFEELGTKIQNARKEFEKGLKNIDERVYAGFDLSVYRQVMGTKLEKLITKERNTIRRFFLSYLKSKGSEFRYIETENVVIFRMPKEFKEVTSDLATKQKQFRLKVRGKHSKHPLEIAKEIQEFVENCTCKLCPDSKRKSCSDCSVKQFLVDIVHQVDRKNLRKDLKFVTSEDFHSYVNKIFLGKTIAKATFSPELANNENIELITVGNKLVENAIEDCKKRGFVAKKHINLSKHVLKGFEKFNGLSGLLFNFKVSFISFDNKEEIIPIVIDLKHMKYEEELSSEINWLHSDELPSIFPTKTEDIDMAYQSATKILDNKIKVGLKKIRKKNEAYYEEQIMRIEDYYQGMDYSLAMKEHELEDKKWELWEKIKRGKLSEIEVEIKGNLTKIETQLAQIRSQHLKRREESRENRLKEIKKLEEQNKIKIKKELINAAIIEVVNRKRET